MTCSRLVWEHPGIPPRGAGGEKFLGLPAEATTPLIWTWMDAWKMKTMLDEEIPPKPAQVFL